MYVENATRKELKLSILRIVNKRISFYCQNTNLLPPIPKKSLRHLKLGIQEFDSKVCFGSGRRQQIMSSLFDGFTMPIFLSKNLVVQRPMNP